MSLALSQHKSTELSGRDLSVCALNFFKKHFSVFMWMYMAQDIGCYLLAEYCVLAVNSQINIQRLTILIILSQQLRFITNQLLQLQLTHISCLCSTMCQYLFTVWHVHLLLSLLLSCDSDFLLSCSFFLSTSPI